MVWGIMASTSRTLFVYRRLMVGKSVHCATFDVSLVQSSLQSDATLTYKHADDVSASILASAFHKINWCKSPTSICLSFESNEFCPLQARACRQSKPLVDSRQPLPDVPQSIASSHWDQAWRVLLYSATECIPSRTERARMKCKRC
jgi:hypothetical protein